MRRITRRGAAAAAGILSLSIVANGGVRATPSSDGAAPAPPRPPARRSLERKVDSLVRQMTLQEKLEQVTLLPDFKVTPDEIRKGLGSILSVTDPKTIHDYQKIAVEESPHHIPLLFAFDTIHGFRTIFPIPLG